MKDYQEAYKILSNPYFPKDKTVKAEKIILELINEKLEQESRKEKLIVGSEWECVANCIIDRGIRSSEYVKNGDIVKVYYFDTELFVFIDDDRHRMIPTQQFLLCFKPIESEDIK